MDPNNEKPNPDEAVPGVDADPAAAAAAAAAAGADGAAATPPDLKPDADAIALSAFEKGVAEVGGEPTPAAAKPDAAAAPAAGDKPEVAPTLDKDGKPVPAAAPADGKPDPKDAPPPKDQAVEDEIKALGITNERTQKRFRELSERAAEVEPLRLRAARADEWETTVTSTGATPEQFGATLGYLQRVCSGDPKLMNEAFDQLSQELVDLGKLLNRAAPGVDPLDAYPDLKAKVAAQDMDRADAEELARGRTTEKLRGAHDATRSSAQQQEDAMREGTQKVAQLGAQLRAADPAGFEAKYRLIGPMVNRIQKTLPPAQWAAAIKEQWDVLPVVSTPAPKPAPGDMPIRPTGNGGGLQPKPKNDVEAFDLGVATARAAGK